VLVSKDVCYYASRKLHIMSNWFLMALAAPFLWSVTNHIDKYMLSKYLQERSTELLLIFSALASVLILLPVAFVYRWELFSVSGGNLLILFFVGLLSAGGLYFYLKSLTGEEASIVVPLFQVVPVFGYVLSYFILGETLSGMQVLSSLVIIFGVMVLAVEIRQNSRVAFKGRLLLLISVSSLLFALYDVLFKMVAITESFWVSVFWQAVGLFLLGAFLLLNPKFRYEFFQVFRNVGGRILSLNIASELLYTLGSLAHSFATLLAPVALVLVVSGLQPLFVFIGGVFLTLFLPRITKENISPRHLAHKLISIAIITVGSYFLYSST